MRILSTYKSGTTATIPLVVLDSITGIGTNSATANTNVTSNGGSAITSRGVSFYSNSDLSGTYIDVTAAGSTGALSIATSGLSQNTTYYTRAWAINSVGKAYSNVISFTTTATGYVEILSFTTNCPNTVTFDPAFYGSGTFRWDLGDGTVVDGLPVSHTYSNANSKTVRLYAIGSCSINTISFQNDYITGVVNLSNSVFQSLQSFTVNYASELIGITFPETLLYSVSNLTIRATGLSGILNLSMFKNFAENSEFFIQLNNLTAISIPSQVSGSFNRVILEYNNLSAIDISMFKAFSQNATISISENDNKITSFILPNSITGIIGTLNINALGFGGNLDLTMFNAFSSNAYIGIGRSNNITSVTFANSITGTFAGIGISGTSITSLNLLKFSAFSNSAAINIFGNSQLVSISFATSISGVINTLIIGDSAISGTLDLSMFRNFTESSNIQIYNNTKVTAINFSITAGSCQYFTAVSNDLSYANIVAFTALLSGNSSYIKLYNNNMTVSEINRMLVEIDSKVSSSGSDRSLEIYGNSAPDSSSGGYNGMAAQTSLISKGVTIS